MSWVLFDYGGVISQHQPAADLARLAAVAGCAVPEFSAAYWPPRLGYDRGDLDAETFWREVGNAIGRSFSAAQVGELTELDIHSWLHIQEGIEVLIAQVAEAGHRLALLSNAPAEVAGAVSRLPVAAHFEHLVFSCFLRAAKPDAACFGAALARLDADPGHVTFLDDRPGNVAAAAGLGMRGIHFAGAGQAAAELARHGVLPGAGPAR